MAYSDPIFCDEIPAELFEPLKDDVIKVLHLLCQQQICKTQQGSQDWKRSVLIPIPKKGSTKNVLTIGLALIFHAHKVTLKILHFRLQDYVKNQELPEVQAGFRKGRGTRDQIANICWIIEKAKEFQKNFISSIMQKPLTVWIMTTCGKLLERWEYQTILPVS